MIDPNSFLVGDAQIIALALAGIVSPFLTLGFKKLAGGVSGDAAFWLATGVSAAMSALIIFAVGGFTDLPGIITPVSITFWTLMKISSVFGLGQVIYKLLRMNTDKI